MQLELRNLLNDKKFGRFRIGNRVGFVGWMVGWSDGWIVGWLDGWMVKIFSSTLGSKWTQDPSYARPSLAPLGITLENPSWQRMIEIIAVGGQSRVELNRLESSRFCV